MPSLLLQLPPDLFFWNEVLLPLAGMGAGLFLTLSIIKAVTRQLDRRHEARIATAHPGEMEGLRNEMGQLRSQVESLEERLDFAERLLTQERNRRSIEPGNRES